MFKIYTHCKQKRLYLFTETECHCSYTTQFCYYSLMLTEQSPTSPTSDSAAGTVQFHAVLVGSEPATFHPVLRHLPAALLLLGSPSPAAADLQARQENHICLTRTDIKAIVLYNITHSYHYTFLGFNTLVLSVPLIHLYLNDYDTL